ncbi:MAG TPA: ATP-binding protein [Terriglobia bacterium]|nr:ATP-binding protein [Terriglobia bacterium]
MKKSLQRGLNLRTKLLLGTCGLVAFVTFLVVLFVSRNMQQLIREETRLRGFAIAQLFGATNLNHLKTYEYLAIQQNANRAKSENDLIYVVVYDKEGRIAADTENSALVSQNPPDLQDWKEGHKKIRQFREVNGSLGRVAPDAPLGRFFVVTLPVVTTESPGYWGTVQLGISAEHMYQYIGRTQLQIIEIGSISMLIGIAGALFLSKRISKPLSRLLEGVIFASSGDLSHRIRADSGDELEILSNSFNSMMDQIQVHQESRIQNEKMIAVGHMVNTILHDCRTPVTVIKGYASLLKDYDVSRKETMSSLDFISFEVERIERMLEEILSFSLGKGPVMNLREVVVDEFLQDCGREVRALLQGSSVDFSQDLHCPFHVSMDSDRFRRAILNIAANAKDALKGKGKFSMCSSSEGSCAIVLLKDNGPGIPLSLKERIFEPFFTHGKPLGIGLGMAITKKIIEEHSGTVEVDTGTGTGTTFTIRLPLVQSSLRSILTENIGSEDQARG